MSRVRTRRRRLNLRFAVLCLAALFALAGLAVWLWAGRGLPGEDVAVPDYVQQDFLTVNPWSRPGTPLEKIDGVVIHYVGNPDTTAQANRNYFEGLKDEHTTKASSHFVIGMEGEIIQCIPSGEIAYASNDRNNDTLSIECCHPDESGKFTDATYRSLVDLTAWLCGRFEIPADQVIRHYDVTGKVCPKYFVEHEEAWQQFKEEVAAVVREGKEG